MIAAPIKVVESGRSPRNTIAKTSAKIRREYRNGETTEASPMRVAEISVKYAKHPIRTAHANKNQFTFCKGVKGPVNGNAITPAQVVATKA